MGTRTSTAATRKQDTSDAMTEATRQATARLGGAPAKYGFVFVSPKHDLGVALKVARRMTGAEIIGCTTAGEITEEGLVHDGIAVMLVAGGTSSASTSFASGMKGDPVRVANALLAAEKRAAPGSSARHATTVLLTDGLSGNGERVVFDMYERMRGRGQIVGGAAGDEGRFAETHVGNHERNGPDAATALHVTSESPWGVGVNHGLRSTTKPMRVNKAQGNVIFELDGVPAFEVYRRHAAKSGVSLTRESAGPYLIGNELGIHFFDRITRARAPLSVGADGSLSCAADVPQGSMVSILDGEPDNMVAAARSAAEEAKERLNGAKAAGVLLFDCVCRGMILKTAFNREIDAVRSVFGDVPIAGFLTYGEIARYEGKLDGWHNATAVVVAVPA
jgi:methyl-accepting chemotaxis protein